MTNKNNKKNIKQRLEELEITLGSPPQSIASYQPYQIVDGLVVISGQLPMVAGELKYSGQLGKNVSLEDGIKAAYICAINILSQLNAACNGDLERVERCVRIGGFVSSHKDFKEHPQIINGASELMTAVFGDLGVHARAAVGCSSLPLGAAVEVEATFKISI